MSSQREHREDFIFFKRNPSLGNNSHFTWSLARSPETPANETIKTVTIENDRNSHIKSLTLTINFSDKSKQQPSVIKLEFNTDRDLTLHRDTYSGYIYRSMDLNKLRAPKVIHDFLIKDRFYIGPKFSQEVEAFFENDFAKHKKITLPSKKETIQKLCELANERLYIDMVNILSGVKPFTLTGDMLKLGE